MSSALDMRRPRRDPIEMYFGLLGPLEISDDSRPILLRAPKQRALLALLLLRRGEVATVESIAEQLWTGDPPATGTKAVRVYVGELRKSLGADVIVTLSGGYAIPRDGIEIDVDRFERLVAEGRQRLEEGNAGGAAAALRGALALWRGPALADFRYDDFAQREITRLEEARLAALEARVDADLALGREEELVPELQALVAEQPLRERLCGQLMLALYGAGRQADALAVYRETRRRLVVELGIEPGRELQELERAILAHDDAIGRPRRRPLVRRARRRPALLVAAGASVVVAAAAAAVAISVARSGGGGISSVVHGNSVAAIDPSTGRVVAELPVGATPTAIAVGPGAVWVLNADDQTISRIDSATKEVRTFGIGSTPTDLAAGAGETWVMNGGALARAQFAGTAGVALTRLDPNTGAAVAKVALPHAALARSNVVDNHVAVAAGSVWAIAPDFSLVRIDRQRNAVAAVVPGIAAVAVTAGHGEVWAVTDQGALARVAIRRDRVSARVRVPAVGLTDIALGGGSVWATDPFQGTLWRIDPGPHVVERTIDVGAGSDSVAYGSGAVWVTNSLEGTLRKIDPTTNRVVRVIPLGGTPRAVAVGKGAVWVAVAGDSVPAASPQQSQKVEPVSRASCGPLVSGSEPARFIVVSDLPLRGGPRFVTPQMSAAVLHVLRAHRFRAGSYSLAFQSCDHSTPQTGLYDDRKCAANAKAYAANADVIGVIGPYNSGCAYDEIPIASRAGLPMISPTNSDVGLTRPAVGAPPGALRALYPTGRRSYARLMSPDDAQAAADALLARRLGARRVFVLDDGGYGAGLAVYFARAAKRLGLQVVATAQWDPHAPNLGRLVARARRSNAQAVFLCGLLDSRAGEVLAALRQAMPRSTAMIGCDGLLPVSLLFERAGRAARGTYLSIDGIVNERLPSAGRKFLRDFGSTQPGAHVDVAAVYAAQATELLLDAIGRSDGTRASVSAGLFGGRVRYGLIGSFGIDSAGDPAPTPVTIVRAEHGGGANTVGGYDGARVDRVITAPPRLLGNTR